MRSVPNILSAFRICLVPVFIMLYFMEHGDGSVLAALVFVLAAFSDFLDGYIARKYKVSSRLGMVLDPLGDKLMTISALACITIDGLIPVWAVIVAFIKEALMAIGGLIMHRRSGVEIPPSNIFGKASTVVFFVVCAALMLFRQIPGNIAAAMISVAIGLMLIALGTYAGMFLAMMKKAGSKQ